MKIPFWWVIYHNNKPHLLHYLCVLKPGEKLGIVWISVLSNNQNTSSNGLSYCLCLWAAVNTCWTKLNTTHPQKSKMTFIYLSLICISPIIFLAQDVLHA